MVVGDSKAVSAVRTRFGVDHRVDADQFARSIDECTAGVTGIDGGIGLNELSTGLADCMERAFALTMPAVTVEVKP